MDTICNGQTPANGIPLRKLTGLPDTTCAIVVIVHVIGGHRSVNLNLTRMDFETECDAAIPRQSLTVAVADKLREQIIRGAIPEGAQLRQDAIATQYQVSRIPVREALRQLDAEGLIEIVPNRGAVVPALSPDDIEELFSIRALLEPEVLKLSIPHLTNDHFSQAEAVLRKYVSELRRQDHLSAWGRLNWQFHSILYSCANQPRFMAIIRNVNNSGERYTRLQLYLTHGMKRANEEHHRILELCRERDVSAACKLLRQHIQYAGESLKQALEQKRTAAQPESGNGSRRSTS
jgi:DNA-binding GntR family transcriptional regulator